MILCTVGLLILSACSATKPASSHSRAAHDGPYVVSVPKAAFYKYPPVQSFGPDLRLRKGQRLTKLDHDSGFSHVVTDDGIKGYIANEDIAVAPRELLASVSASAYVPRSKRAMRESVMEPLLKTEVFDVNDVPLPSADGALSNGEKSHLQNPNVPWYLKPLEGNDAAERKN